jgi:hypothetical protein
MVLVCRPDASALNTPFHFACAKKRKHIGLGFDCDGDEFLPAIG